MLCGGWEGNRRFGVALRMRHRLKLFSTYTVWAHGLDREMSTPPTLSCGVCPHLPLPVRHIDADIRGVNRNLRLSRVRFQFGSYEPAFMYTPTSSRRAHLTR